MIKPMRLRPLFLTLVAVIAIGCGEDAEDGRLAISGSVSYQGQPLEDGRITFLPTGGDSLPMATAAVKDGTYRIRAKNGPAAGSYTVKLEGYRSEGAPRIPADALPSNYPYSAGNGNQTASKQFLPPKYSSQSTLTVDFTGSQSEYDFDLE